MIKSITISIVEWLAENLVLLLFVGVLFMVIQFFNLQEHQAISDAAKHAEIIKIKLSLITEQ
jgi:hypothetical protein